MASTQVFGGPAATPFDPGVPGLDLFPAALWARVAARRWRLLANDTMGYGRPGGYWPLRQALAAYLSASRGLICAPGQVIITAGILQTVKLLAEVLLDPGDLMWVEEPGIVSSRAVFAAMGVHLRSVLCDGSGLNVEAGRATGGNPKAVYLCPSRNYPLGVTMPLHRRLELLAWAREQPAWIIENDHDSEFRFKGQPLPALQSLDPDGLTVYLGSFSKTLFPGLRLSYMVVPESLAQPIALAQQVEMPVPSPIQAVVTDFINEGHYANHIRHMRQAYHQRESLLAEGLRKEAAGLLEPLPTNAGFHFLVRLNPDYDQRRVNRAAERQGITANDLYSYFIDPTLFGDFRDPFAGAQKANDGNGGGPGVNALALGFACVPPEKMAPAIKRLAEVIMAADNEA